MGALAHTRLAEEDWSDRLAAAEQAAHTVDTLLVVQDQIESVYTGDSTATFACSGGVKTVDAPPSPVGEFSHDQGWTLRNLASSFGLIVDDATSASRLTLAPGVSAPLPFTQGFVRFSLGALTTEIRFQKMDAAWPTPRPKSTTPVNSPLRGVLNDEQLQLLIALCEPRLRGRSGADARPPTNRQTAHRLGWTVPKYNRKLDHLCRKFDRLGVTGLRGALGAAAGYRKLALVDFAVTAAVVNQTDLALIPPPAAAFSAPRTQLVATTP